MGSYVPNTKEQRQEMLKEIIDEQYQEEKGKK